MKFKKPKLSYSSQEREDSIRSLLVAYVNEA